ncbi:nuclear factor NF-kappa-B p110 subunit [Drosophila obscura]|uniref:nuclear factor NF-kappa-B p110 subunit n=1 Tax=Drosophila obscura TaxID=7282 RepID=UPI001BB243EF|nr:nuclear factor NF-kappa-B p110 subunit [Drosophila obscura]
MNHIYDLDKGKNVLYVNDASSTSGYSSENSATSTMSPAQSPETLTMQNDFANLNLPQTNSPQPPPLQSSPYQLLNIDASNFLGSNATNATDFGIGNMFVDHHYFAQAPDTIPNFGYQRSNGVQANSELGHMPAALRIVEQPVEKFRFRYKSEMHGTHGSLNGANSKRTPKTFPEVTLCNYDGPAVIRCSLFQTNLDSPHSHQLVVRKEERDVCDPHDLHVSKDRGYVAQFINMGIIHTAKKFIYAELLKKKQDRRVFEMKRRELSKKEQQTLHQETEREAKDMNLNQVRLCFEAYKIEDNGDWVPIATPVYSNAINNRKSAQTGELRIVRLSKPTGSVLGNDELILLVEKVSKKNIKVRFFEENEDGETVWESYAKFRESDVHHQYAIVCQTPTYKDKDVDREVNVFIELIRPSDDERSVPPLQFRYKPRDAIASRKRRRTCSMATNSSSGGSAQNSGDLPRTLAYQQQEQQVPMGETSVGYNDQTISQEFGRDSVLNGLISTEKFRELCDTRSDELERMCTLSGLDSLLHHPDGVLQEDGHGQAAERPATPAAAAPNRNLTPHFLNTIFKIYEAHRRSPNDTSRKQVEELFTEHALRNDNNDTLLHEVIISQRTEGQLTQAIRTIEVMKYFKLHDLANNALNADGDSALHVACQHDREYYIRPLLSLGCSPNQQNHAGNTPLHMAVKEERMSCIDSFLKGGTGTPTVRLDLTLKNDDGLTPLHMAIRQNKYDVAKKLIKYDRSSISVANTKDGNNALHMAVLEQSYALIVLIVDAQDTTLSDILMSRNSAGYTPLELARCKGDEQVLQLLDRVYSEKNDAAAMTWIPNKIKEELDTSSDESSEAALEIKTEVMGIKTESSEEDSSEMELDGNEVVGNETEVETTIDSKYNLQLLLSNKQRFEKLKTLLNEPMGSGPYANQPKWKHLARISHMERLSFFWMSAESMLDYILNNAKCVEYSTFAMALESIDSEASALLN